MRLTMNPQELTIARMLDPLVDAFLDKLTRHCFNSCGRRFAMNRPNRKFCSEACRVAWWNKYTRGLRGHRRAIVNATPKE